MCMSNPILIFAMRKHLSVSQIWLDRAARARRIGMMLSHADASILEAFAQECEAQAAALLAPPAPPIAA